jgi:hypothetical protein
MFAFASLKRLIPSDRAEAVLLGLLLAILLVLVSTGVSLVTWGTPAWGSAAPIPTAGLGEQILADVVMNRAGVGFAAWVQKAGNGYRVHVAQFLPDSGWSVGVPVDEGGGSGQAKLARLAVSDNGDALIAWSELIAPVYIWSNRFVSGRGWGSPTLLHVEDFARLDRIVAAMDGMGNGIVLWSQEEPDPINGSAVGHLYASRLDRATGWEVPRAVGTGWASSVFLGDDGTAVGAWATTGGTFHLVAQERPADPWSAPVVMNPNGSGYGGSRLCGLGGGRLLAVWQQQENSTLSLWSSVYAASSGWSAPQVLLPIAGGTLIGDLACSRGGDAVLVSISSAFVNRGLQATWWNATTGWSAPVPLGYPTATGVDWPHVAVDDRGDAVAVWWQQTNPPHAFLSQFTKGSSQPSAVPLDSTGFGGAVGPLVGIDSVGDILVVWNQGGGLDERVWANQYFVPGSGPHLPLVPLIGVVAATVVTSALTVWWWRRGLGHARTRPRP